MDGYHSHPLGLLAPLYLGILKNFLNGLMNVYMKIEFWKYFEKLMYRGGTWPNAEASHKAWGQHGCTKRDGYVYPSLSKRSRGHSCLWDGLCGDRSPHAEHPSALTCGARGTLGSHKTRHQTLQRCLGLKRHWWKCEKPGASQGARLRAAPHHFLLVGLAQKF